MYRLSQSVIKSCQLKLNKELRVGDSSGRARTLDLCQLHLDTNTDSSSNCDDRFLQRCLCVNSIMDIGH